MKKPAFYISLYIDVKGLHWTALEKGNFGYEIVFRKHQLFTQIFGESALAGQSLLTNPAAAIQGLTQMTTWLKSEELKTAAAGFLQDVGYKSSVVGLCFSETFGIFRYFSMPKVEKIYLKKAIPIEARKYIPFPMQDCFYDWATTELMVAGKPTLGVVFAALQKPVYEAAQDLIGSLGLKCLFVESLPFAISRSVDLVCQSFEQPVAFDKEDVLTVYLDLEQVQMVLFAKSVPILSRSIYLMEAASRGSFVLERRKLDLQATLDFLHRQLDIDTISRILLLGSSSLDDESLKNWAAGISQELGLKVEIVKPLAVAMREKGLPTDSVGLNGWSDMAALGTALRGVVEEPPVKELDLSRILTEVPPKQKFIKKAWKATAAVSAVFFLMGLWRFQTARSHYEHYLTVKVDMESNFPELQNQDETQLRAMLDLRIQTLATVRTILGQSKRFYLTRALATLADLAPAQVWIEDLKYASSASGVTIATVGGAASSSVLQFSGKVAVKDNQEQSNAAQEFFKRLKEEPAFASEFAGGGVSFQRVEQSGQDAAGKRSQLAFSIDFAREVRGASGR